MRTDVLREAVEVATAPQRYQTGQSFHGGTVQMLTVLYGVQGAAHLYQTQKEPRNRSSFTGLLKCVFPLFLMTIQEVMMNLLSKILNLV